MPESRTLNIKLDASINGFAAQLLEAIADQLAEAAKACRTQAEQMRRFADVAGEDE